jgi:hypothetical protein
MKQKCHCPLSWGAAISSDDAENQEIHAYGTYPRFFIWNNPPTPPFIKREKVGIYFLG